MSDHGSRDDDGRAEPPARACNACRRMKIKCIDKEKPPCKRCRHMKLDCSFEDAVEPAYDSKARIDLLENQMGSVNRKLEDISSLLTALVRQNDTTDHRAGASLHPEGQALHRSGGEPHHHSARHGGRFSRHHSADPISDEDDPLESAVRMESMRILTDREEAERLRTEGHAAARSNDVDLHNDGQPGWSSRKRPRTEHGSPYGNEAGLVQAKGDVSKTFKSPVELGFCSEEVGRQLYNDYFHHSHQFMPVLDPSEDTWDSLLRRSAFVVTVVILVASQVRDGSGRPSILTSRCRQHAEDMARLTLFTPVSAVETVQAMVILACWSDVVWRPACHAMTLAVDMGMHRCLPVLQRTGMGAGAPPEIIQRDRPLVVGARLWLALTKLAFEVAYNNARPVAFIADYVMTLGRAFLRHPLSNLLDSRLVVSVELLACRQSLFRPYDAIGPHERSDLEEKVLSINPVINGLFDYWMEYYDRAGLPRNDFLVNELGSQRAYAIIRANSLMLYGIRDKHDVFLLSAERRECLKLVLMAADFLVESIGAGGQAKDAEYGNHYFHTAVVSVARLLIRLIGLMPGVCDSRRIDHNMEQLLSSLPKFPGYSFVSMLRADVTKARQQGILPNTSGVDLSSQAQMPFPPWKSSDIRETASSGTSGPSTGPADDTGNALSWLTDLDFSQDMTQLLGFDLDSALAPSIFGDSHQINASSWQPM